jgi:hypothetical protein
MDKKILVFIDDSDESKKIVNFLIKKNIQHQLFLEKSVVEKIKKITGFLPPIILVQDGEKGETIILESLNELMEIANGIN